MATYRALTDKERIKVLQAKQKEEQNLEELKIQMEALNRLVNENDDFKVVIMDGYLKDYALRNLRLRAAIIKDEKQMRQNEFELNGASALNSYFVGIEAKYRASSQLIEDLSSTLDHGLLESSDEEDSEY